MTLVLTERAKMVKALVAAMTEGDGSHNWMSVSDVRRRLPFAEITMKQPDLSDWLDSLAQIGKVSRKKEGHLSLYQLIDGSAPSPESVPAPAEPAESTTQRESDDKPPRVRPLWNIKERQEYENQIADLKRKLEELETERMTEHKSLALAQYGEKHDLEVVKERVRLAPYAAELNDHGRALVTQICWMLDWNPFFDMYAWVDKRGKLCITPDYKKLLAMVREQTRINLRDRPMTSKEFEQYGLKANEVGWIVEITEVDTYLDYARAGVAGDYNPIIGVGIHRPDDRVPATWTPQMNAKKRGLRNGLYQLAEYKIVADRMRQAMQGAGFMSVSDGEDGFTVELPAEVEQPKIIEDWWQDTKVRQRFWIELGKLGFDKKREVARLLQFEIVNPDDSQDWAPRMNQFPDLENALAYARVCVENAQQNAEDAKPDVIEGEVIEPEPAEALTMCANCGVVEAHPTPAHPLGQYCANCSSKLADKKTAKEEKK